MKENEAIALLEKYKAGTITEEELTRLESWYIHEVRSDQSYQGLEDNLAKLDQEILMLAEPQPAVYKKLWPRIAAAAILLISLSAGLVFYYPKGNRGQQTAQNKIIAGSNKAYLTLDNGKKITLSDALNGTIAQQAAISITKTSNGQLVYNHIANVTASDSLTSNTITTPKGGQWQVILPDGTKVWLNAASALTYPTTFTRLKYRTVQLSGEAYFEVAKDKAHPFIVKTAKQEVEVLGTHFNINSYTDEPEVKTTLLEGRVKVTSNTDNATKILSPGEQSVLTSGSLIVGNADAEEAVAWKNGYFRFNDQEITDVMRKVARWYDIEVVYEEQPVNERFNGTISRFTNISDVLEMLEKTKAVHFKIAGRRVTVER